MTVTSLTIRNLFDPVRYWDKQAARYVESLHSVDATQPHLKRLMVALRDTMSVLEIGCGRGELARQMASMVRHVHAIDYSRQMILQANRSLALNPCENLVFECGDVRDMQFQEKLFDAVASINVFHLLTAPVPVLEALYASLKPGGLLLMSCPCYADTPLLQQTGRILSTLSGRAPNMRLISRQVLMNQLRDVGFEFDDLWQANEHCTLWVVARKPACCR